MNKDELKSAILSIAQQEPGQIKESFSHEELAGISKMLLELVFNKHALYVGTMIDIREFIERLLDKGLVSEEQDDVRGLYCREKSSLL